MKWIALLILLAFNAIPIYSQTVRQRGFVRTVGHPENKNGTRLTSARLRLAGQNAVKAGQKGAFELLFNDKREGRDAFNFVSVMLSGYYIIDKKTLGPYVISSTVPAEVVLVPYALKLKIEENIRRRVEAEYKKKLRRLEAQKAQLGKEYKKELAELQAEYEKRDMLVNDLVEHYASLDYAYLDSFKTQLYDFIEKGELERVDSLIKTQGITQLEADHASL